MERLAPSLVLDRGVEAAVRRDRALVAVSLVAVVVLAWVYLWRDAASMGPMSALGTSDAAQSFSWVEWLPIFLMWTIMMIGMMLPSAAPAILLYAAMVRRGGTRGSVLPATWTFVAGYLATWTAFSAAAALLQLTLERASLLTPMLVSASAPMSAALLVGAGVYQWLPVKQSCLARCRSPLDLMLSRWRPGAFGPFRLGAEHGLSCVGCCWALMALLFVVGVMDLRWVALVAAYVLAEKLVPAGHWPSRGAGLAMIAAGVVIAWGS